MEESGETETIDSTDCEAAGISGKERKALKAVEVEERVVLSDVVFGLMKGKY